MPRYVPPRREECVNGHDLTDEANVAVVRRKQGENVYRERQCLQCRRARARRWWRENRAKT